MGLRRFMARKKAKKKPVSELKLDELYLERDRLRKRFASQKRILDDWYGSATRYEQITGAHSTVKARLAKVEEAIKKKGIAKK